MSHFSPFKEYSMGTKNLGSSALQIPAPVSEAPDLSAAELNAEGRGPAPDMAAIQRMIDAAVGKATQDLVKTNKELQSQLTIAKEASTPFYVHQIGGRNGVDPREDESIRIEKAADGRQIAWVKAYINPHPQKGTPYDINITQPDGSVKKERRHNWDLARTVIRTALPTVSIVQGGKRREVTLQGLVILNMGAPPEVVEETLDRMDKRASTDQSNADDGEPVEAPTSNNEMKANEMESNPSA